MPTFWAIALGLTKFVDGCDLVGFNLLNFDLRMPGAEYNRAGLVFSVAGRTVVDACRISHRREPRDLTAALKFYCGLDRGRAPGSVGLPNIGVGAPLPDPPALFER